jgi:hypothetical protein
MTTTLYKELMPKPHYQHWKLGQGKLTPFCPHTKIYLCFRNPTFPLECPKDQILFLCLWLEELTKTDQQTDSHNKQYTSQSLQDPCSSHPLPIINPYLLPYLLPKEKHSTTEYHFSYRMQSTPRIHNNTSFILMWKQKKNPFSSHVQPLD